MTLREIQQYRWRTVRELRNGYMVVPVGAPVKVTHKRNGVTIEGEKCACCGVKISMGKVPIGSLEIAQ